jgi:hypothetical protein
MLGKLLWMAMNRMGGYYKMESWSVRVSANSAVNVGLMFMRFTPLSQMTGGITTTSCI